LKKQTIAVLAGVGVLAAFLGTQNLINANLGLQDKVQSCFKRFTNGVQFRGFSVELTKSLGDDSRESISAEQLECAVGRLGFAASTVAQISAKSVGRVDNEHFAVSWEVVDVTTCLKYEHELDDEGHLKSLYAVCAKSIVTDTKLHVTLKDYR
jgi:hypothetical protein